MLLVLFFEMPDNIFFPQHGWQSGHVGQSGKNRFPGRFCKLFKEKHDIRVDFLIFPRNEMRTFSFDLTRSPFYSVILIK